MKYAFMLIGMSTVVLFMYKIDWLFSRRAFWINIGYDVILYVVALVLLYEGIGDSRFVIALKIPLLSSVVFRLLYLGFRKIYKRNPENTFWVFTKKPIEDVIFSMLFMALGGGLPIVLAMWI